MNDQAKIQRTLRLLMLLAGKRWYSPQEINHRIGIGTRTLYRYLQTLEKAGFAVERSPNGYRLAAEKGSMLTIKRLLHFTEEEAVLLYRTLGMLQGESPAKERLIRKLHTLYDCHLLAQAQKQHTLEIVATLQKAFDKKQQVVLHNYRSSNSQTIKDRVVEAYAFTDQYDAVWAYDLADATCKQFKLARMDSATLALHGWQHEATHTIAFTDVFGMAAPKQKGIARLHLTLRAANLLREEHPGSEKYMNPAKTGFEAHLPYADYHGIGRFIKGLKQEIAVVGPAGLKKFVEDDGN